MFGIISDVYLIITVLFCVTKCFKFTHCMVLYYVRAGFHISKLNVLNIVTKSDGYYHVFYSSVFIQMSVTEIYKATLRYQLSVHTVVFFYCSVGER